MFCFEKKSRREATGKSKLTRQREGGLRGRGISWGRHERP
jgi:hypothetical protein